MKTIRMTLDPASIGAAIQELKAYRDSIESKLRTLMERLAAIGAEVAGIGYDSALYAGDNDVTVHAEPNGKGFSVVAAGSTVAFIELGAGITYPEGEYSAKLGTKHGTYGKGYGRFQTWHYYGNPGNLGVVVKETRKGPLVETHGTPPANAMYEAAKEMEAQVTAIAQEVFRT